jgi:two-component system response regulator MprA
VISSNGQAIEPPPSAGSFVLVVEDDQPIRSALKAGLELHGHTVVAVGNGLEALELLALRRPTLIVLDLMMPRMGGIALVQELQRRGLHPGIPLLILSGDHDGEQQATAIGAEGYLPKPLRLPTFLQQVAGLIGG